MKSITLIFLAFCANPLLGQITHYAKGCHPLMHPIGSRPYEKIGSSKQQSTLDFMDCTQWSIETQKCDATLSRSNQEIVTENYSGRIDYKTEESQASLFLKLNVPQPLNKPWDCLDVWTFGDHWLWGEPSAGTAMQIFAVFQGKDGKTYDINVVQDGYSQFAHKYWFLNHLKLKDGGKLYTHFLGFKLKGNHTDVGISHTVYFSSVYIYQESLNPILFKEFPKDLPFPCRKETILPTNKETVFANRIIADSSGYGFHYQGKDANLSYFIDSKDILGNIRISLNGAEKMSVSKRTLTWASGEEAELKIKKACLAKDTLFMQCYARYGKRRIAFDAWYTIRQKSLIFGIKELQAEGMVQSLSAGCIEREAGSIVTRIPFLKYNHGDRPSILYQNDLFAYLMFDWYTTNASSMTMGKEESGWHSGGKMLYIPKTDGKRNPLDEKLFINLSQDVQEVLPTIDNPASPMRSLQADRLWAINGGADLERLGAFVTGMRSKGAEKVTIRYHEDFWREGGESYTFRLVPNPKLGVERIRKHVEFVKNNDWRVGLYTNYTDMAPVNALWKPEWMKQGPNGEWEVSWSRCYAPKPQIAWEQEAILAPQIHKLFNTNHSYCDVHTAVSPITRVDYDFRVPEAAMLKGVIKRYGMLLMNERKAYNGPVYSEGGNHWWYAGLTDGNYANDDLINLPIFPDFSLLKIHPLEMDAANTGQGHQYICYALAYGNIGILSEGTDAIMRYAFLQPMQEDYVMIPVSHITYNQDGVSYSTSNAIKRGLLNAPRLRIDYKSGLQTYVNFGEKEWNICIGDMAYTLPQWGFLVYMPSSGKRSSSILKDGIRLDEVLSKKLYYLNTYGRTVSGPLRGNGHYLVKKEKFLWEVIPLDGVTTVEFDLSLLDIDSDNVRVIGVDKDGNAVQEISQQKRGILLIQPIEDIYKYQIIPAL